MNSTTKPNRSRVFSFSIGLQTTALLAGLALSMCGCGGGYSAPNSGAGGGGVGGGGGSTTAGGTLELQQPPSWVPGSVIHRMIATNDGVYLSYSAGVAGKDCIAKFSLSEDDWREMSFKSGSVRDFVVRSPDNDVGGFWFSVLIKHEDLAIPTIPKGVATWVVHSDGHSVTRFDSPIRDTTTANMHTSRQLALSSMGTGSPLAWVYGAHTASGTLAVETTGSGPLGRFWTLLANANHPIRASVHPQGRIAGDPDGPYLWAATETGIAKIVTTGQDEEWVLPKGTGLVVGGKVVPVSDAYTSRGNTDEVWFDFFGTLYAFDGSTWTPTYDLTTSSFLVHRRPFAVGGSFVFLPNGKCVERSQPYQTYKFLRDPAVTDAGYASWMQKRTLLSTATHASAHPERDRVYFATSSGVIVVAPMAPKI